jgi:glycosyltransferase involved in cell wall biosynthesis
MPNHRISVVIPAYNAAPFIVETLQSVLHQERAADEIVVIDDGSTDDTAALAESWCRATRAPLRLISQSNRGLAATRNVGLRAATGSLIALLDADDLMVPQQLERLEEAFEAPQVVLAFGDIEQFDATGTVETDWVQARFKSPASAAGRGKWLRIDEPYLSIVHGNFIPNNCVLLRRDAWSAAGGWDESLRYVEDRDFFLRLARQGEFWFLPERLARRRLHPLNHSRNTASMSRHAFLVLHKALGRPLSATERDATATAAKNAAGAWLYAASLLGFRNYATAVRELQTMGWKVPDRVRGYLRSLLR